MLVAASFDPEAKSTMDREEPPEPSFFLRFATVLSLVILFAMLMQLASAFPQPAPPEENSTGPLATRPAR